MAKYLSNSFPFVANFCTRICFSAFAIIILLFLPCPVWGSDTDNSMKITLLGTGTPYPSADRFGAAILVQAGGKKLLFDCGRGAVIRLAEAGFNADEIDDVYLTHLHSDHVTGIPDLWLTGWFLGRTQPLHLSGPVGTKSMAQHLAEAFSFDVHTRIRTEALPKEGARIEVQEIEEGKIYDDGSLYISAFAVDHGQVKPAFGYRIDYLEHSAVISGDTKFSENLIKFAKRADCLLQVAWKVSATNPTPSSLRSIATAEDAAQLFTLTRPKLAVAYH
jgi:ribonuclease Z